MEGEEYGHVAMQRKCTRGTPSHERESDTISTPNTVHPKSWAMITHRLVMTMGPRWASLPPTLTAIGPISTLCWNPPTTSRTITIADGDHAHVLVRQRRRETSCFRRLCTVGLSTTTPLTDDECPTGVGNRKPKTREAEIKIKIDQCNNHHAIQPCTRLPPTPPRPHPYPTSTAHTHLSLRSPLGVFAPLSITSGRGLRGFAPGRRPSPLPLLLLLLSPMLDANGPKDSKPAFDTRLPGCNVVRSTGALCAISRHTDAFVLVY